MEPLNKICDDINSIITNSYMANNKVLSFFVSFFLGRLFAGMNLDLLCKICSQLIEGDLWL